MLKNLTTLFFLIINLPPILYGQSLEKKSEAYDYALSLYMESQGVQCGLNNGSQYAPFRQNFEMQGHVFYISANWQRGNIVYDGVLYTDILLMYDLRTDAVLTAYQNEKQMQLRSELISEFTIAEKRFIHIIDSS